MKKSWNGKSGRWASYGHTSNLVHGTAHGMFLYCACMNMTENMWGWLVYWFGERTGGVSYRTQNGRMEGARFPSLGSESVGRKTAGFGNSEAPRVSEIQTRAVDAYIVDRQRENGGVYNDEACMGSGMRMARLAELSR